MNPVLAQIKTELSSLAAQVQAAVPSDEPFNVAHGNWSFPGVTRSELVQEAEDLITEIDAYATEDLGTGGKRLADYPRRLVFLRGNTVQQLWGQNCVAAVQAYRTTLAGLRKALGASLTNDPTTKLSQDLKRFTTRARAIGVRLDDLQPRTASLQGMVEAIERAHETADQLPTDLETLAEGRRKVDRLADEASIDRARIETLKMDSGDAATRLHQLRDEAISVLAQCESAYSAATSQGLAAAFSERSRNLSTSMVMWVIGLIGALAAGTYFGSAQLHALNALVAAPSTSITLVVINVLLSMLSVGAPIWFGWLATKQIGQRFRLSEDYAFKASISRAYEGYRKEAARIDPEMEARLLASALDRLDEQPLRLVESASHGSPWHELASSKAVQDALSIVPGAAAEMKEAAAKLLDAWKARGAQAVATVLDASPTPK